MEISKSKIDRAGKILSNQTLIDEEYFTSNEIFDVYRTEHLKPLAEVTSQLQYLLGNENQDFYLAMRLKRRPQILRKLKRWSVRLSQLQDIAGARIIVEDNKTADMLANFINDNIKINGINVLKETDYREKGRDDSGYRSKHIILEKDGFKIELQLRSRIQHYWAELIERTSVVYGHFLKELDGDRKVIEYFKKLSDIFYEIESGRKPSSQQKIELDQLYQESLKIIEKEDKNHIMRSHIDHNAIKALVESSKYNNGQIINWILIFDWDSGKFVSWDKVPVDPYEAVKKYIYTEEQYKNSGNFEVVLVGASDTETIEQTHRHYFGIESYNGVLQSLDSTIADLNKTNLVTIGEKRVLYALDRHQAWGNKSIKIDTLKNHFCKKTAGIDKILSSLKKNGYVIQGSDNNFSLNTSKKGIINSILNM